MWLIGIQNWEDKSIFQVKSDLKIEKDERIIKKDIDQET